MKMDIRHIAKLSKLRFPEEQLPALERQMQQIAQMVENMPDLKDEELVLNMEAVMQPRPDVPVPSMKRDELFAGAPARQAGCVVVPKTV